MSMIQARSAIAQAVGAIDGVQQSIAHGGRFTLEDLKRYTVRAPCLLTACLGVLSVEHQGGVNYAEVQWGVFVVTKGTSQDRRDAEAITLAEAVLNLLPKNRWGLDRVHIPQSIRADNLYTPKLDALGIALWGVTWRQKMDLVTVAFDDLDDFSVLHADVDMAEADEQIDVQAIVEFQDNPVEEEEP